MIYAVKVNDVLEHDKKIDDDKLLDFHISKGLLQTLLTMKAITQQEFDKCLIDLKKVYLV